MRSGIGKLLRPQNAIHIKPRTARGHNGQQKSGDEWQSLPQS